MTRLLDKIRIDCRYYIGEKPCKFGKECHSCDKYDPMGNTILIIKLGAAGDALRTTPILKAIKEKYGCCHITWVTDQVSYRLLANNSLIDKLMLLDFETVMEITARKFDALYSGDKATGAISMAAIVKADEKFGFTLSKEGALTVFNKEGAEALYLGISDPFKFRQNKKTYQQTLFEMFKLPWNDQKYILEIVESEKEAAKKKLKDMGAIKGPLVGLNTGAGTVFATKKWPKENFVKLANKFKERNSATLLIMGGPGEVERNREIMKELGTLAIDSGCDNPVMVFAAMTGSLDALVTSDTLAMHLAIACEVPVVALFGPTTDVEVSLYGKGVKLVGKPDCAPCYKAVCKEEEQYACMKEIGVEKVLEALENILAQKNIGKQK